MRILYVAAKYDYGDPTRGYSFEHFNFYHPLVKLGNDVIYFDFYELARIHGQDWMNQNLKEIVASAKPDMMFTVLALEDQLYPSVVREISEKTDTITVNWFCDDHYRFENYSCDWAPNFNWVVTTAQSAMQKYVGLGYRNAIKSQWGCNHFLYRKLDVELKYDVTFVGQPYGNRRAIIDSLRKAGIDVRAWGHGWELGRLSQEEMIRVFNQSRINLNLSNASCLSSASLVLKEMRLPRWASRILNSLPGGWRLKNAVEDFARRKNGNLLQSLVDLLTVYPQQIKGRNFEIPGCGGFLLTEPADNLGDYYDIGKEVVCFQNMDELVSKVKYYLSHEDERFAIAQAGYERTLGDHTYVQRFNEILNKIGLS